MGFRPNRLDQIAIYLWVTLYILYFEQCVQCEIVLQGRARPTCLQTCPQPNNTQSPASFLKILLVLGPQDFKVPPIQCLPLLNYKTVICQSQSLVGSWSFCQATQCGHKNRQLAKGGTNFSDFQPSGHFIFKLINHLKSNCNLGQSFLWFVLLFPNN